MPGITETERTQMSAPASVQLQILNELKIMNFLLAEEFGKTDILTDMRKDINLLSE